MVIQQEEAESRFLKHFGQAEELLHAPRPVEWGFTGIHNDDGCHEEKLRGSVSGEIVGRGRETYQAVGFRLWWSEPDFSGGQPAVFDPVPF